LGREKGVIEDDSFLKAFSAGREEGLSRDKENKLILKDVEFKGLWILLWRFLPLFLYYIHDR
jgi:hypothetical protein